MILRQSNVTSVMPQLGSTKSKSQLQDPNKNPDTLLYNLDLTTIASR